MNNNSQSKFTSTDALFEKYPGWSPYQYCRNNPINLLDWNGKKVKVSDQARAEITFSIEEKYRGNFKFEENGDVTITSPIEISEKNLVGKDAENFAILQWLVNSEEIIEVECKNPIVIVDNGEEKVLNLNYVMGGAHGIALPKRSSGEEITSVDETNRVYRNINKPTDKPMGFWTAHELYGHIFLYLFGLDYKESTKTFKEQKKAVEGNVEVPNDKK
jgi:hypothetical protein